MGINSCYIIDLSEVYKAEENLVGKKAHELGMLWELGIPLPNGFVITTEFHKKFLRLTGIDEEIKKIQAMSHPAIAGSLFRLFEPVKKKIMHTHFPRDLSLEFRKFYRKLAGLFREPSLNIFISPLKRKSIQFLGIKGDANLILKIKEIWAEHLENPISIIIQKNIQSNIKGKIITNDSLVDKKFADFAKKIQKHFYFPQEADYVMEKNKIYITGIKPFTGIVNESVMQVIGNKKTQTVLIKGISINPGIVTGPVKIFKGNNDLIKILSGEIIVLPRLDASLYGKIKKAKAIISDDDLSSSYDRMLYRKDVKKPTVIRTKNAAKILQNGNIVTVNGMSGEIYSGGLVY